MNTKNYYLLLLPILFLFSYCNHKMSTPANQKKLPITDISLSSWEWSVCSMPEGSDKSFETRGQLFWNNPITETSIEDIWPELEVDQNGSKFVDILNFNFTPNIAADPGPQGSWNGLIKYLPSELQDHVYTYHYIEITIKGDSGMVYFDLGEISEDAIPNKRLNTEDIADGGIRNGILDSGEDIGIDGMPGIDPNDFWDINHNGIQDQGEPASWDDWNDETKSGTEGNKNAPNGNYPDTEDINQNGSLDIKNNYYEYCINLDKSSPYTSFILSSLSTNRYDGWYTYRIDLSNPSRIVGDPNPWRPASFRIWCDGLSKNSTISIALIDFKK